MMLKPAAINTVICCLKLCQNNRNKTRNLGQSPAQSNPKVVVKRTKFWTFFALPNFKEVVTPKSCTRVITPI